MFFPHHGRRASRVESGLKQSGGTDDAARMQHAGATSAPHRTDEGRWEVGFEGKGDACPLDDLDDDELLAALASTGSTPRDCRSQKRGELQARRQATSAPLAVLGWSRTLRKSLLLSPVLPASGLSMRVRH